jgi:nucleotide-binding universal stress UspA family protein
VLPHPASESATLGSVADGLRARGARSVRERIVTDVDPAAAIIRVAREDAVDLVAIGTRGESGLRRFLLGGVVEDVVRSSETPILLLRDAPAA